MNRIQLHSSYIPYLDVLAGKTFDRLIQSGEKIVVVNIICPGYGKRRDGGPEVFDFVSLSDTVRNCPNVILMIDKMNRYLGALQKNRIPFEAVMILADKAVLNYPALQKVQNVRKTLDTFYVSIKDSGMIDSGRVKFIKMSDLGHEFSSIPIGGVKLNKDDLNFVQVSGDIIIKAREYLAGLCFDRINRMMAENTYNANSRELIIKQATHDVGRFVKEYGLAGLALQKLYKNPVILFTEPSGYLRGYFYHSYISKQKRMPVVYLS